MRVLVVVEPVTINGSCFNTSSCFNRWPIVASLTTGVQDGVEFGVDCGGDCRPCNATEASRVLALSSWRTAALSRAYLALDITLPPLSNVGFVPFFTHVQTSLVVTIGDGSRNGGLFNGPLLPGRSYGVRLVVMSGESLSLASIRCPLYFPSTPPSHCLVPSSHTAFTPCALFSHQPTAVRYRSNVFDRGCGHERAAAAAHSGCATRLCFVTTRCHESDACGRGSGSESQRRWHPWCRERFGQRVACHDDAALPCRVHPN